MNERVLVVVAHSDDECIGCGATMARHVYSGDEVQLLVMTDGVGSRDSTFDAVAKRAEDCKKANAILGTRGITQLEYADNQMDAVPQLLVVRDIEKIIKGYEPTIVYTHWPHDMNVDHRVTSRATAVACRPVPGCSVNRLFYFEVASSTEWQTNGKVFAPNWFVDVSKTFEKKKEALHAYADEMRLWPHARSLTGISNLASVRGVSVGVALAEAFVLARGIE